MDMEQNRNDSNQNKKPEGDRPKSQMWTALIITLALVLVFSWVFNTVRNSQYTQTTYSDFLEAMENNKIAEAEIEYDRVIYMTKEEAAKDPAIQRACFTGLPSGDHMEKV